MYKEYNVILHGSYFNLDWDPHGTVIGDAVTEQPIIGKTVIVLLDEYSSLKLKVRAITAPEISFHKDDLVNKLKYTLDKLINKFNEKAKTA